MSELYEIEYYNLKEPEVDSDDEDRLMETLNTEQRLQLSERANEIYRQQLRFMQDHLASLRSLIQDKENIIENMAMRYDLGILAQEEESRGGFLSSAELHSGKNLQDLLKKAWYLLKKTIIENFELRENINELMEENFHLRNEIYEMVCIY